MQKTLKMEVDRNTSTATASLPQGSRGLKLFSLNSHRKYNRGFKPDLWGNSFEPEVILHSATNYKTISYLKK